jgi:hypothetical protein
LLAFIPHELIFDRTPHLIPRIDHPNGGLILRFRICVCIALAGASLSTFFARAICAQAIIPVSYQLHAQAFASDSTGTVNSNPADITQGAVFDTLSHGASATSPTFGASGSASTGVALGDGNTIFGNIMRFSASASASPGTAAGGNGSGSGFGKLIADIPQQLTLSESAFGFGLSNFGNVRFVILRGDGSTFLSQSISGTTSFSGQLLNLPPDRYTFTIDGFRGLDHGGSASAGGMVNLQLVPEPGALSLGGLAATIFAQHRRRRRHHRPRARLA